MRHAIADAANQLAQGGAHARNPLLQHAQVIAAGDAQVVAQIASGNSLHDFQGFTQRAGDLAGDDDGGQYPEQQHQQRADQLNGVGAGAFVVAALQLEGVQRIAAIEDARPVVGHFLAHVSDGFVGVGVDLQGVLIVRQRVIQGAKGLRSAGDEIGVERRQAGNRLVELLACGLLVSGGLGGDVGADLVAGDEEFFANGGQRFQLLKAILFTGTALHDAAFQQVHRVARDIRVLVHFIARHRRFHIRFAHGDQGRLVLFDDLVLFVKQLEVFRALERCNQLFLLHHKGVQIGLYVLRSGFVAIGEHVLQARHAQVGQ